MGWAEMCEGFMREEGIMLELEEGLLGGAAMVVRELRYSGAGLGGAGCEAPATPPFFLSLFSCRTSFSYFIRVENTSSSSPPPGLEMTAGAEYCFCAGTCLGGKDGGGGTCRDRPGP